MADATVQLTPEQVEFFNREGYLAIPQLMPPNEVAWVRDVYDRLFNSKAGWNEGNQFDLGGADEEGKEAALPQLLNPVRYAPELKDGQFRLNALAVAKQLLGPGTEPQGEHAIMKPARTGATTPWHQDEAYWSPDFLYHSVSIWIPLQDATLENGCMQFIPKSHLQEVQPHHCINNDPRIHGLEIDQLDASKAVACPLPAGGATVHGGRMLHYAGPNRSDQPRRAYILGFGTKAEKYPVKRDFYWNRMKQTPREQRARQAESADGPASR